MNLSRGSSLFIILLFMLAACSQNPSSEVMLDPQITETQKLTASDAVSFGSAVAVAGDLMVVGAPNVNLFTPGAAYLYQKDLTGSWQFVKKLVASDGAEGDYFGGSVAISGNTVVVGASFDTIGTNYAQGSAYIFERDQGGTNAWGEVKKLVASDGADSDYFGISVAISGDTVVIGANFDEISFSSFRGSAYIFERNRGGTNAWGRVKKLIASDGADKDDFGRSVAISGNTIVVGASGDDTGTITAHGSVYLFERDESTNTWAEVKKLLASDGSRGDAFGNSVAISGNTIVVGAYGDESSTGSAYLFERDQNGTNAWGEVKKLLASDGAAGDWFGYSVATRGDVVVVGALFRGVGRGAAYLYKRNLGGLNNWGQGRRLFASDRLKNDRNGSSVAISSNTILVGAPGDDVDININQGSAYIY